MCCFNRPFDDQASITVRLETEAKLHIQQKILDKDFDLVWSYILDFENSQNPFEERKSSISKWSNFSTTDISETPEILQKAKTYVESGIKPKDALHVASAIEGGCEYFITTDLGIIKKRDKIEEIRIVDPVEFLRAQNED